jgi:hypothetical protein
VPLPFLPVAAENGGATGAGVAHEKNMFVGVRGMQELPGQLVVHSGCGGGFGNSRAGIFVGTRLLLGGNGAWRQEPEIVPSGLRCW